MLSRGPPIQPEEKLTVPEGIPTGTAESAAVQTTAGSQFPLHVDEDFFADPDYSEFDCMDEPPDVVQSDSTQVERKDSRPPRNLLELVDYFPGTIANQVPQPPHYGGRTHSGTIGKHG